MNQWTRMRESLRTDLACERRRADTALPDIEYEESRVHGVGISRLVIKGDAGAKQVGKPIGTYLTATFPAMFEPDECGRLRGVEVLSDLLASLLPPQGKRPLLVVGLGNRALTADALGPRTVELTEATAHLEKGGICVLAPGVKGQSGMEAARIIKACAAELKPRAVIAIDALCARSTERLVCTVQLCDTGITPGSGIREPRTALNQSYIGCPVIAVGVPTLVSSAAMVCEMLEKAGAEEIPPAFHALLGEENLYVCPKSIDEGIENGAALIAGAINRLSRRF